MAEHTDDMTLRYPGQPRPCPRPARPGHRPAGTGRPGTGGAGGHRRRHPRGRWPH
ncbi:hypothetical protein QP028_13240 [Corynebacterium suedekumii]|nr:hypothetical protein QP028_13240 [Corynebacterium suedekumii]